MLKSPKKTTKSQTSQTKTFPVKNQTIQSEKWHPSKFHANQEIPFKSSIPKFIYCLHEAIRHTLLQMSEVLSFKCNSEIGWFAIYVCGNVSNVQCNNEMFWWNIRNISMYFITSFICLNVFGSGSKWKCGIIKGDAFVIACK